MNSIPYICRNCTKAWLPDCCKKCEHYEGPTDNFKPKRQEYDLVPPFKRKEADDEG